MFENIDFDALIEDIVNKTESPIVVIKVQLKIGVKDHDDDIELAPSELKELLEVEEDAARKYLRKHLRSVLRGTNGENILDGIAQNSDLHLADYFVKR